MERSADIDLETLGRAMASAARLINSAEFDNSFKGLHAELSWLCRYDNLIIYGFEGVSEPSLLGSNLSEKRLRAQMGDFASGLFLLDPFVIESLKGVTGLLRLRDIMPDDFLESEFYRHHYTYTNVQDEVRFIIPVRHDLVVHVFVEREMGKPIFSCYEVGLLKAYHPIVDLYIKRRMQRLGRVSTTPRDALDIGARIRSMGGLTSRECEVVELILRGNATKSIARVLGIEVGTVTNHKRNVYAKLGIHSQAQLFELFLRRITVPAEASDWLGAHR